jgi:hypothetical protein
MTENTLAEATAGDLLSEALNIVTGDRADTHGDLYQNHCNIADLWNAYLSEERLTPHDVAMMMVLLKVARTKTGSHNPDDYVDIAGYAGTGGAIRQRMENEPPATLRRFGCLTL